MSAVTPTSTTAAPAARPVCFGFDPADPDARLYPTVTDVLATIRVLSSALFHVNNALAAGQTTQASGGSLLTERDALEARITTLRARLHRLTGSEG